MRQSLEGRRHGPQSAEKRSAVLASQGWQGGSLAGAGPTRLWNRDSYAAKTLRIFYKELASFGLARLTSKTLKGRHRSYHECCCSHITSDMFVEDWSRRRGRHFFPSGER